MKLEIFTLCDHASVEHGKMHIMGAFDRINAHAFPTAMPHCAIALRLRFEAGDEGEHELKLTFTDLDGHSFLKTPDGLREIDIKGKMGIKFSGDQLTQVYSMVFGINHFRIPEAGEYQIGLSVDGQNFGSLPLFAVKVKPPEGKGPVR